MTGLFHTPNQPQRDDATTCQISDAQHHLPSRRWVWTGSDRHTLTSASAPLTTNSAPPVNVRYHERCRGKCYS